MKRTATSATAPAKTMATSAATATARVTNLTTKTGTGFLGAAGDTTAGGFAWPVFGRNRPMIVLSAKGRRA